MMSPIGKWLAEFQPFGAPPAPFALPQDETMAAILLDDGAEHRALDEAREAGVRDATEAAETRFAARHDAIREEHAQALDEARRQWVAAEGAALAMALADQLAAFEDRVAAAVAAILEPLLPRAVAAQAEDALRSAIEALLTSGEDRPILVSGPADLVERIRLSFAGKADITCETGEVADVTIRVGDTRIHSAVAAWAERLSTEIGAAR